MAPGRLWRLVISPPAEWRETFLRLAADTPEGRTLAPAFDGNILSFDSLGQGRSALRLVKDLIVQANFCVEHQACGGVKTYVGETRVSMTCSCGAGIARKVTG